MNDETRAKLEQLRIDFEKIKGYQFVNFFCPILFRDEATELCKGHIVNHAFPNTPRAWTVQRKDVDGFYGRNFEADFTLLGYKTENLSPDNVITDRKLIKKFAPKILIDGQKTDYFVANGNRQNDFTRIEIENHSKAVDLILKMHPKAVEAALDSNWEIEINKDIRLPALVSLIKSAHLTLFEMLGYFHALSAGGYFVGRQILGEFYLQNQGQISKSKIMERAYSFFQEFVNMVRPIQSFAVDIQGTITDKLLFVCKSYHSYWAFIVFIRTGQQLHAVMIPVFDKPENVATFMDFLKREREIYISGSFCRFDKLKNSWEIDKKSHTMIWPKSGFTIG